MCLLSFLNTNARLCFSKLLLKFSGPASRRDRCPFKAWPIKHKPMQANLCSFCLWLTGVQTPPRDLGSLMLQMAESLLATFPQTSA